MRSNISAKSTPFSTSRHDPTIRRCARPITQWRAHSVTGWARRRESPKPAKREEFWALRDVSFELERGKVLGIIGRNGAGKSTLLKILSRITEPSEGRVTIRGRVASLLEVGTGFHPELTGRENIFLNGSILGMTRAEIKSKFDEIVDFAGVEKFLDTPVKRYSSGMYVRLAFAVAAHLEPEILIVDEVLAVGDAEFQKKCLGKMREVSRGEGRTVLFVSHNMAAISGLCQRAILLDHGDMVMDGTVDRVISQYLSAQQEGTGIVEWAGSRQPACPELRFRRAFVTNESGETGKILDLRCPFTLALEYEAITPTHDLIIGFDMHNADGILVCGSNNIGFTLGTIQQPGVYQTFCRFPGAIFNAGRYEVRFIAHTTESVLLATELCLTFEFEDMIGHGGRFEKVHGIVRPNLEWEVVAQ